MNNDLISREALKEEIVKLCERINANYGITIPTSAFTRIIDNAPTVEYPFYTETYQSGYEEGKNERLQGEMKVVLNDGTEIPVYVANVKTVWLNTGKHFGCEFIPTTIVDEKLLRKIINSSIEDMWHNIEEVKNDK